MIKAIIICEETIFMIVLLDFNNSVEHQAQVKECKVERDFIELKYYITPQYLVMHLWARNIENKGRFKSGSLSAVIHKS